MATTNKIYVQIDNQKIELTGEEKQIFIEDQKNTNNKFLAFEAEQTKKKEARENAIKKLAEIAGLTDEEINAII